LTGALSLSVKRALIGMAAALGLVSPASAAPDSGLHLGEVRAQLFYQHSGELSDDLIGRKPRFNGWNTEAGEGDAKEPSQNLLVVATLVNPGEETFLDDKVTLRITDEIDQEIRVKEFTGLLIPAKGTLHLPMWLDDATCLGTVTISATWRDKSVSGALDLICGT
jgi:hypothetical protein